MSSDFTLRGLSVQSIHGDRSAVDPLEHMRLCQSLCSVLFCREQYDREQALDDFKTGIYYANFYCLVLSVYCSIITNCRHWMGESLIGYVCVCVLGVPCVCVVVVCVCVQVEWQSSLQLMWHPGDWTSRMSRK